MLALVGKVGTCIPAIPGDAGAQSIKRVVFQLVVQFVEEFHANDFTVGSLGAKLLWPVQAMGFEQYAAAVHIARVERGPNAHVRNARQRRMGQAMDQYRKDAAGGGLPVRKAQVQGLESKFAPELAAVDHMA